MNPTNLDIAWVLFSATLVFMMQMGFLCLETGLTRSKNNINVATKNLADFGVSIVLYWVVGFGLMFGVTYGGWIGCSYFLLDLDKDAWQIAFFVFQVAFCGAAVTILSGAVAERMVFRGYIIIAVVVSGLIYPLAGHWVWNGFETGQSNGWLAQRGFIDFAGSTVVHSVGGWIALATLLIIGPRNGRYDEEGRPRKVPASNLPTAALGVLILWIGWIGFNGGSALAMNHSVSAIVAKTMLAGGAGLVTAILVGWTFNDHTEIENAMNGSLAGLVAITAPCFAVSAAETVLIGAGGGVIMIASQKLLDRLKIDDAVGAIPVHLFSGIWGTLAVGIFGDPEILGTGLNRTNQIQVQFLGIVSIGLWAFGVAYVVLRIINRFLRLRVTPDDEHIGLNISEHGARTDLIDLFEVMERQGRSGDLNLRAPVEPFTEVGRIASRYNQLMESLEVTVKDLTATTVAKERMESELSVGRQIQMSMLPLMFPIFPTREEFSVFAKVKPAREVGGDFYDIFFIDDNQVCFCIADVSDKGVPAALFMAVSKTLLKSKTTSEFSTATIVNRVNTELAKENENCMFVTLFLAILDIRTGNMVYTNGGHNPPLIRRADGTIAWLSDLHGPVVGVREEIQYKESRLEISRGDTMLLYTDGVTEAVNTDNRFYGTQKLEAILKGPENSSAEELVHTVIRSVDDFSAGAKQADDITALAFQYLGVPDPIPRESMSMAIENKMEQIGLVLERFNKFAEVIKLPIKAIRQLSVVFDELLNNIITYAYRDERIHEINVDLEYQTDRLKITIVDDGIPFNPFNVEAPSLTSNIEEKEEGGLGIYLVRNMMNKVGYQREGDKNVVSAVKYIVDHGTPA